MIDLKNHSEEFKLFYHAFAFETYGKSMGREADHAAVDFRKLSTEEQQLGIEWFLYLFSQKRDYYGLKYLEVIRYSKDKRFIPLLKDYYKQLKSKHNKTITLSFNGTEQKIRLNFRSDLDVCKATIKELKKQNR